MTDSANQEPALGSALRQFLESRGVSGDEIREAEAAGRLPLLAVDQILVPSTARYDRNEVAELAGIDPEQAVRLWRALGFPDTREDERVFTDADVDALRRVAELLQRGATDFDAALQLTRTIGSSFARIAEAEVTAIQSRLAVYAVDAAQTGLVDAATAAAVAEIAGTLLENNAQLLDYVHRRHLQAAAQRHFLFQNLSTAGIQELAVGFADMVGYTALSNQLDPDELSDVVDRFEALAYDTVASLGGRVVKMIGDEVMFVADDPLNAARIALRLAEIYAGEDTLSDVRVGLAFGSVVAREGDYYGPVVNLASRIVNLALPGTVLTSDDFHSSLEGRKEFEWRDLRPRFLKGIGRVDLWALRRPGQEDAYRTAPRSRRGMLQAIVAQRRTLQAERAALHTRPGE